MFFEKFSGSWTVAKRNGSEQFLAPNVSNRALNQADGAITVAFASTVSTNSRPLVTVNFREFIFLRTGVKIRSSEALLRRLR